MQFSVGDKVVHPHHGPGRVASVDRRDLMDGPKRYYVIEIPGQGLTVHVPVVNAGAAGLRPAMTRSRFRRVLSMLRGRPHLLSKDFKVRQERVGAQLRTGRVVQLARVVRDLTWHRHQGYLTRTDYVLLRQGSDLLAAEMALVSGDDVSDVSKLIKATMTTAIGTVLT